ncbi:MAG: hypothetical protein IPK13_07525 [Deltaproteobacteria bacterium]|nr:hypothetical protein [Deltaproteobacteria bacterium]
MKTSSCRAFRRPAFRRPDSEAAFRSAFALFAVLVLAAFARVAWAGSGDGQPPVITDSPVGNATLGTSVTIRATIEDQDGVFAPSVYVRSAGSTQYLNIPMHRVGPLPSSASTSSRSSASTSASASASGQAAESGVFEATIPGEVVVGDLEYFVEAFDVEGNGPSQRGTPQAPLLIEVSDQASPSPQPADSPGSSAAGQSQSPGGRLDSEDELPRVLPQDRGLGSAAVGQSLTDRNPGDEDDGVAGRWWFWTLVAVAVTGGTVAAFMLASGNNDPVDSVVLRVGGPDPAARL